jgi:hypothetical protein
MFDTLKKTFLSGSSFSLAKTGSRAFRYFLFAKVAHHILFSVKPDRGVRKNNLVDHPS